jgi:hypothetical protein
MVGRSCFWHRHGFEIWGPGERPCFGEVWCFRKLEMLCISLDKNHWKVGINIDCTFFETAR